MSGPQVAWLKDGRRLHLNHGPIDLVLEAFGEPPETDRAYAQAVNRFGSVLEELVAELGMLRKPVAERPRRFASPIAQRMEDVAVRHYPLFVTPMAAVAGAVAEAVLQATLEGTELRRAYVNNGGDIAFHLSPGERITAAIGIPERGFGDRISIAAGDAVRGIATSGRGGRSHSLGIADAVTVLAENAAAADVAATLIANAVDLPGHPAIRRAPARTLSPDSDLGDLPVTIEVGELSAAESRDALAPALAFAQDLCARRLIAAAALFLNGESAVAGTLEPSTPKDDFFGPPGLGETSHLR